MYMLSDCDTVWTGALPVQLNATKRRGARQIAPPRPGYRYWRLQLHRKLHCQAIAGGRRRREDPDPDSWRGKTPSAACDTESIRWTSPTPTGCAGLWKGRMFSTTPTGFGSVEVRTPSSRRCENSKLLFAAAAREAGVGRIVHFSVASASPESGLPYFRGKGQVEEILKGMGMPFAIIRPTLVFGRGDLLLNNMA